MAMQEITLQSRREIASLLASLFGEEDFRIFLEDYFSSAISDAVSANAPLAKQIHDTVVVLVHHGKIDRDLFEALAEIRPARRADIRKCEVEVFSKRRSVGEGESAGLIVRLSVLGAVVGALLVAVTLALFIMGEGSAPKPNRDGVAKVNFEGDTEAALTSLSAARFADAYQAIQDANPRDGKISDPSKDDELGAARRLAYTRLQLVEALAFKIALIYMKTGKRREALEKAIEDRLGRVLQLNLERIEGTELGKMHYPRIACLAALARGASGLCDTFQPTDELTALGRVVPGLINRGELTAEGMDYLSHTTSSDPIVRTLSALFQWRKGNSANVRALLNDVPDHLVLAEIRFEFESR